MKRKRACPSCKVLGGRGREKREVRVLKLCRLVKGREYCRSRMPTFEAR
jgi:hypothetical protein